MNWQAAQPKQTVARGSLLATLICAIETTNSLTPGKSGTDGEKNFQTRRSQFACQEDESWPRESAGFPVRVIGGGAWLRMCAGQDCSCKFVRPNVLE